MGETEKGSRLVQGLLDPEAYPHEAATIEMLETHISYIFFAGTYVYKVKKPVDFGFLDFATLEKRRYYCEREVELNRRICPEVYLGVEEVREQHGFYSLGGQGRTVEYAVKMRRLPEENRMDLLLGESKVTAQDVARVASRIARFHEQAPTGTQVTSHGDLQAVRQNLEENFAQTARFVGTALSREVYGDVIAYSRAFMEAKQEVFHNRSQEGRIRDCHGDLHAAQVFLEPPPDDGSWDGISIIDCIEFNERFRCSDIVEDMAFLAMDLDFHGRPDLSAAFTNAYVRESRDPGVFDLLDFFKTYRAYVRGKVACFRTEDSQLSQRARDDAMETARAYFELSRSYIPRLPKPAVFLMCGVTGTGKSTLAAELAQHWSAVHISSDLVRKSLAGIEPQDHRYEPFMQGIYSPRFSSMTYQAMLNSAKEHLLKGESVILDGTFRMSEDRASAVAMACDMGLEIWVVECRLGEGEVRERLERRMENKASVSDGRWELYHRQLEQWETVEEVAQDHHIILDTAGGPGETMRSLLQGLYYSLLHREQA